MLQGGVGRPRLDRARALLRRPARPEPAPGPIDFTASLTEDERALVDRTLPHSITSAERLIAVADGVEYVIRAGVPGALVECGVWRGGSVLAMLLTLQRLGVAGRDVYLFDTFEGMTEPTEADVSRFDEPALTTWRRARRAGHVAWEWFFEPSGFGLEVVRDRLAASGYPAERLRFVVGRVEDTIPARAPEQIALLRLDTDWYESTRHELEHLYPRLAPGGVLIIDDYGHWEGCRRAVDEYFAAADRPILLSRSDYTGRIGVKR